MKIAFAPHTFEASGLLRCFYPLMLLRDEGGHDVRVFKWERDRKGRIMLDFDSVPAGMDLIVLHQPLNDVADQILRYRARGAKVVIDCDDDYIHTPTWLPTWQGLRDNDVGHTVAHLKANLKAADFLTVSTPALAETYRPWQPRARVLRNGLDWGMWEPHRVDHAAGPLTIGYVGALSYRTQDLKPLRGILGPWMREHPDVRFLSVGRDKGSDEDVPAYLDVPEGQADYVPWHDYDEDWPAVIARIHVGLAPLAPHKFNEAKSHLKGMEHNAVGAPFIASPTESYLWWGNGTPPGIIVSRPREWLKAIDLLARHQALREQLGNAGRSHARRWSVQNRWRDWQDTYLHVVADR